MSLLLLNGIQQAACAACATTPQAPSSPPSLPLSTWSLTGAKRNRWKTRPARKTLTSYWEYISVMKCDFKSVKRTAILQSNCNRIFSTFGFRVTCILQGNVNPKDIFPPIVGSLKDFQEESQQWGTSQLLINFQQVIVLLQDETDSHKKMILHMALFVGQHSRRENKVK